MTRDHLALFAQHQNGHDESNIAACPPMFYLPDTEYASINWMKFQKTLISVTYRCKMDYCHPNWVLLSRKNLASPKSIIITCLASGPSPITRLSGWKMQLLIYLIKNAVTLISRWIMPFEWIHSSREISWSAIIIMVIW